MASRGLTIALILLVGCASVAGHQAYGPLPPTDRLPRTHQEWQKEMSRRDRLPGPGFKDAFPDHAADFDALREATSELAYRYAAKDVIIDVALAEGLLAEFYVDRGHPILNSVAQDFILDPILHQVARYPEQRLTPAARERLADGLVEYFAAGGGQYSPAQESSVAHVLGKLGRNDPELRKFADALLADALDWVEEVGADAQRRRVHRRCAALGRGLLAGGLRAERQEPPAAGETAQTL